MRQLLTESVTLSLIGGLLGLLLARLGVIGLLAVIPGDVPRLLTASIEIDRTTLLYTLGISTLTGFIFGGPRRSRLRR